MRPCIREGNVCLWLYRNRSSYILYKRWSNQNEVPVKFGFSTREFCSENPSGSSLKTVASIQNRTRSLLKAVRDAQNQQSQLIRLERFNSHVLQYVHSGRNEAIRGGAIETVLNFRKSKNTEVKREATKGLALLGCIEPVKGSGIRILTIDGGGARYSIFLSYVFNQSFNLISSNQFVSQWLNQSINLSFNLSIIQSICQSTCQSVITSINQSIKLSVIQSFNQSVSHSVNYLSFIHSISPSVDQSINQSVCNSISQSIC